MGRFDELRELYFVMGSIALAYLLYVMYTYSSYESPYALIQALYNRSYVGYYYTFYVLRNITLTNNTYYTVRAAIEVSNAEVIRYSLAITLIAILSPIILAVIWHYLEKVIRNVTHLNKPRYFSVYMFLTALFATDPALLLFLFAPPIQFPQYSTMSQIAVIAILYFQFIFLVIGNLSGRYLYVVIYGASRHTTTKIYVVMTIAVFVGLILLAYFRIHDLFMLRVPLIGHPHLLTLIIIALVFASFITEYRKSITPIVMAFGIIGIHEFMWSIFFLITYPRYSLMLNNVVYYWVLSPELVITTIAYIYYKYCRYEHDSLRSAGSLFYLLVFFMASLGYDVWWYISGFKITVYGIVGPTPLYNNLTANICEVCGWWVPSFVLLICQSLNLYLKDKIVQYVMNPILKRLGLLHRLLKGLS